MIPTASSITSKLPHIGTNIFTKMSGMATQYDAINLSQGFPDFPLDPILIDHVKHYMTAGYNQYAPMPGVPVLRQTIAEKLKTYSEQSFNPDTEITITAGATEALYASITALIRNGDEVIIFDPAYDLYAPAVTLAGGKPRHLELLLPDFSIDWDELEQSISNKTKAIVINNPNNPAGSVLSKEDLGRLSDVVKLHDLIIFSDEVYEHMIYDGLNHQSILSYPELRARGIAMFSFGKTFHATGWKMGYCVAPNELTVEIRKVHQFVNFSANTPIQYAVSDYLKTPKHYQELGGFFQKKRDHFLNLMQGSRFKPLPSQGTYFQLMSYADISDQSDRDMATWMTQNQGVASIPISVFYQAGTDNKLLRFCFAKNDETLKLAAEKLCKI